MTDALTCNPGGETGRCCVERERERDWALPPSQQGLEVFGVPTGLHHSSHGSQVQGTSVAFQTNSPR